MTILSLVVCLLGGLTFLTVSAKKNEKRRRYFPRFWLASILALFTLVFFFCYLLCFSFAIYSKIPAMFGGGRHVDIYVMLKEDKQTQYISKLIGMKAISKLSPALKLIATTDKSYIFIDPSNANRSIELPREMVAAVVFGSDR